MEKDASNDSLEARTKTLLEDAIKSGRLNPGRGIVESSIGKLIGASRSPVRAATAALHADGLISRFSGRGFIVGPSDAKVDRRPITAATLGISARETGALKVRSWEKLYPIVEPDLVRAAIHGNLKITESDAAEFYGVGRTVMHEVLLLAQANGLAMRDERSRWRTVPLDETRISEIYELRKYLEPEALSSAAESIGDEKLELYAADLAAAARTYPKGSPAELYRLEKALHIDCVDACPNTEIVAALRRTRCIHLASRYVLGNEVALPSEEPFFAEHSSVITAMRERRHSDVVKAARAHFGSALPKVLMRIENARDALAPLRLPFVVD